MKFRFSFTFSRCRPGKSGVDEGYDTETIEVPQPPCGDVDPAAPSDPIPPAPRMSLQEDYRPNAPENSEELPEYTVTESSEEVPFIVI